MKNLILWIACAVFLSISSEFSAFAAYSFPETYGVSIRSMSLGGAFTAMADDYSASYFNPAGLAQADQTSVSIGLIQPFHNMKLTSDDGSDMAFIDNRDLVYYSPTKANDGESFNTYYPMLGLSLNINTLLRTKVNIPTNIQVGFFAGLPGNFNHLFTLSTTSPDMPTFIAFGDQIEHFSVAGAIGFEVKKNLAYAGLGALFGASIENDASPMKVHGAWIGDDYRNLVLQSSAPAYSVLAYTYGLLFTPFDQKLKIGVAYKGEIKAVDIDFSPLFAYSPPGMSLQNMRIDVDAIVGYTPEQFNLGAAYVLDPFTVSIDFKRKNWSNFSYSRNFYTLYNIDENQLIISNPGYEDPGSPDFDDVTDIGVGVEYRYSKKLVFTGGYEYRPTPVPDQSYRVSNYLDMDKNVISFGLNLTITSWMKVAGLVQYMMLDDFEVYKTGNESGYCWKNQTSYKIDGDAFVLGASVEFGL